jgi:hypothetical protein
MVSLRIHGTVKSFGHPTYGLQHLSIINVNRLPINAYQFNNQLDHGSIKNRTNVLTEIWTGVLHDWKRVLYQLSYQPLTSLIIFNLFSHSSACQRLRSDQGLKWGRISPHQLLLQLFFEDWKFLGTTACLTIFALVLQ